MLTAPPKAQTILMERVANTGGALLSMQLQNKKKAYLEAAADNYNESVLSLVNL